MTRSSLERLNEAAYQAALSVSARQPRADYTPAQLPQLPLPLLPTDIFLVYRPSASQTYSLPGNQVASITSIQGEFPSISFFPTETGGKNQQIIEIDGSLWIAKNAEYGEVLPPTSAGAWTQIAATPTPSAVQFGGSLTGTVFYNANAAGSAGAAVHFVETVQIDTIGNVTINSNFTGATFFDSTGTSSYSASVNVGADSLFSAGASLNFQGGGNVVLDTGSVTANGVESSSNGGATFSFCPPFYTNTGTPVTLAFHGVSGSVTAAGTTTTITLTAPGAFSVGATMVQIRNRTTGAAITPTTTGAITTSFAFTSVNTQVYDYVLLGT